MSLTVRKFSAQVRDTNTGEMVPAGLLSNDMAAVYNWLDAHPEATTTVDFRVVDKVFDTVTAMIADSSLEANDNVRTNGYYSLNDGGGAIYKISTSASRACAVHLSNGLYAVLVGDSHNTRQIGIRSGDKAQTTINAYIADISFTKLTVIDEIHLKKPGTGTSTQNIELVQITRSNFVLAFEGSGRFVLETLNDDYYRMIAIHGTSSTHVDNITICDPVLVGDADTIGLTTGEYGHGIYTYYADKITVYNGNISKCFGDAVGIGIDTNNVNFIGTLYCEECGRQGVSVANGNSIFFDTIVGKNIKRTAPASVIDFEPNTSTQSIVGGVKTVHAINCKKAVCVAGPGNKKITVGDIISDHTDGQAYDCDFELYGSGNTDHSVSVAINNMLVTNMTNRCISIEHPTHSTMLNIENVLINGANKPTNAVVTEATVFLDVDANLVLRDIHINRIKVINNETSVSNFGVFLYSNASKRCTLKDCYINYEDDCTAVLYSYVRYATLENTLIKTPVESNGIYDLNSDIETIDIKNITTLRLGGYANALFVRNFKASSFTLSSLYIDDYTANTASYIVVTSSGWRVDGIGVYMITFDHQNKTITITKIGA